MTNCTQPPYRGSRAISAVQAHHLEYIERFPKIISENELVLAKIYLSHYRFSYLNPSTIQKLPPNEP